VVVPPHLPGGGCVTDCFFFKVTDRFLAGDLPRWVGAKDAIFQSGFPPSGFHWFFFSFTLVLASILSSCLIKHPRVTVVVMVQDSESCGPRFQPGSVSIFINGLFMKQGNGREKTAGGETGK